MEVILEGDPWRIERSPKGNGGRILKEKPKNIQRSAISARDSPQISINQEESLTHSPALGHLLSGVLILSVLSPKLQEISDI